MYCPVPVRLGGYLGEMLDRIFGGLPWPPQFFIPGCFCCGAVTVPRRFHTCSVINSCMHAVGGSDNAVDGITDNSKYEPVGDTWSVDTPLSVGRGSMASCAISNNMYIFCGVEGSSYKRTTEKFDGSVWTSRTDSPTPGRGGAISVSLSYMGHVFAGSHVVGFFLTRLRINDQYNPSSDSWITKTQLPAPARNSCAAFVLSPSAYVVGGDAGLNDNDQLTGDTWVSKTNCPAPARGSSPVGNALAATGTGTSSNAGYISCGRSSVPLPLRDHDEYVVDAWAGRTDCPTPGRFSLAGASVLNTAYICGGSDGVTGIADTDSYVPDTWTSRSDMI